MKLVFIWLFLIVSQCANAGFGYYRTITSNHLKVPSTQTDFGVLVSMTNATFKTVGNGGHVQNSNGYDIGFYSDIAATTKLKWEMEKYDGTAGTVVAWVKIASLSSSVDNLFYVFYGDASISTDQSDPTNVWDSNFLSVWHMADNAANTTILKSTSTGSNATNNVNTSTKTASGQINSALDYNGSTDGSGAAVNLSSTNIITLSFWMNWTTNANDDDLAFEYSTNYNSNNAFIADWNDSGGSFVFGVHSTTGGYWTDSFTRPSAGSWHLVHLVIDGTLGAAVNKAYVDGTSQSLSTNTHNDGLDPANFANSTLYFMSRAAASLNAAGTLDEVRLSTSARSSDWITTEYNNQSDPGTFETIGSEISISSVKSYLHFFDL